MIHPDFKKLFTGIIDNNLTMMETLDDIEGVKADGGRVKLNNMTRRKLRDDYKKLRHKINSGQDLNLADGLFLMSAVNLSLIGIKSQLARTQATIDMYDRVFPSVQEKLGKLQEDSDAAAEYLSDIFSESFLSQTVDN